MVMLIVGGTGMLYGGLVGAAVFMVAHHYLSGINADLLAILARRLPDRHRDVRARRCARRLLCACRGLAHRPQAGGEAMSVALRTVGLASTSAAFAPSTPYRSLCTRGERHAVIGPNGAGKTSLINLAHRGASTQRRRRVPGRGAHHAPSARPARQARPRAHFPDQQPVSGADRAAIGAAAVCEQRGVATNPWRPIAGMRCGDRRCARDPAHAAPSPHRRRSRKGTCLRPAAAGGDRAGAGVQAAHPPARRAGRRRAQGRERGAVPRHRRPARRRDGAVDRARHGYRVPLCAADHRARGRVRS